MLASHLLEDVRFNFHASFRALTSRRSGKCRVADMHLLKYTPNKVRHGRRPTARKCSVDIYAHRGGQRARAGVAERIAGSRAIGKDLLRAQWRWPVGMPLCRPLGNGLWEVRTDLPTKRTARVLLCLYREHLVARHGFIKKTRTTPDEDLALARKRKKELEQ
jgi:phage-related protein